LKLLYKFFNSLLFGYTGHQKYRIVTELPSPQKCLFFIGM